MSIIFSGIIIGILGGAGAGFAIWGVKYLYDKSTIKKESNRVYEWLKKNTTLKPTEGKQFRSTRTIASYNNLTQDRVRYICSIDERIILSTGSKEDMWGIYCIKPTSVYEERGILTI